MSLPPVGLGHYLGLSGLLLTTGLLVVLVRRERTAVLAGVVLGLNAAALSCIAISRATGGEADRPTVQGFLAGVVILQALALAAIARGAKSDLAPPGGLPEADG